ncbi:hypothetical protein [Methylobacillus glycogenes]|uniref:hypothetical protein n=1 Tax=Methylobacillus glycogenes TaxID=406 RepID=UPI001F18F216|nr:hypothetical protein [Methylobacillus glycogenes]
MATTHISKSHLANIAYSKVQHIVTTLGLALLALVAFTPAMADQAYITNQGDNTVSVIDLDTLQVTATIAVGKSPVGVATSAKLGKVYISNVDSHSVSVIDSQQLQVTDTIDIAARQWALPFHPTAAPCMWPTGMTTVYWRSIPPTRQNAVKSA